MRRRYIALLLGLALAGSSTGAEPISCRSEAPVDVRQRPTHWFGTCERGVANGLGVLRAGSHEPYDFFLGRMAWGRPRDGVIVAHGDEWLAAHEFNRQGSIVPSPDATAAQFEALFTRGAAAAEATAKRMEQSKKPTSARYYRALARKVRRALPE